MLTREGSPRRKDAAPRLAMAVLMGLTLAAWGGSVSNSVAAEGGSDPFEYRMPSPGDIREGGGVRNGNLGNPGSTDADPDEFSVNNVGIRNPDVQVSPVGGGTSPGGWHNQLRAALLHWFRIWLPRFFTR